MENNNFEQQTNQYTDNNVNPQPQYQQPPYQQPYPAQPPVEDKSNVGLNIVSFLFPIVGLILFLVFKDQTPKKAKGCGKAALIAVILYVILVIISIVMSVLAVGAMGL